jgi:hypothetical protein
MVFAVQRFLRGKDCALLFSWPVSAVAYPKFRSHIFPLPNGKTPAVLKSLSSIINKTLPRHQVGESTIYPSSIIFSMLTGGLFILTRGMQKALVHTMFEVST